MQQMPKTIISDTSCFIILTNIGELDLLHKVYGRIVTTIDIANEYGENFLSGLKLRMLRINTVNNSWKCKLTKGNQAQLL